MEERLNSGKNSENLSNLVNQYNVHFITAFLLDEMAIYSNKQLLKRLSENYRRNDDSGRFRAENLLQKFEYNFKDPYRASLLFALLLDLDIILYENHEFIFNNNYCKPSFMAVPHLLK